MLTKVQISVLMSRLFEEDAVLLTKTKTPGIWKMEVASSKSADALFLDHAVWYEFEDETQNFSDGHFQTEEEAKDMLKLYVENCLK
ncbi:hypothetical protein key_066 [Erwinia phage KEY]|uniref:Uncharacterized protein n=2 Tax=Keyvirus TaxID=3152642 RepID=A0AAE7WBN6_9CAUD|nr:hypothetical protein AAS21_gp066 [Pantoea phage vB_PagS_AAS21]QYC51557.1 hypothetical protein key_066 [Erwinia phage KEY]